MFGMTEKSRPPKRTTNGPKPAANGPKPPAKTQAPENRPAKKPKREGKSIRWMVIALLVAVAFLGWAIAAASYASDIGELHRPAQPRGRGVAGVIWLVSGFVRFLWNAVVQIPSAHRVVAHTVTRHPVLLVLTALCAGGVGLFGWWMSRLERQFAKEDERFRRVSE
jgi:hypothetical protein